LLSIFDKPEKVVTPVKTGVQRFFNYMELLDTAPALAGVSAGMTFPIQF
jgi:hypothetical protein